MSPQEFKAWFEGFSENMDGPPNQKQWKKINEKIKMIDNSPVQVVREYRPTWYPIWYTTISNDKIYKSPNEYKFYCNDRNSTVDNISPQPYVAYNGSAEFLAESSLTDNAREIGRLEYVE